MAPPGEAGRRRRRRALPRVTTSSHHSEMRSSASIRAKRPSPSADQKRGAHRDRPDRRSATGSLPSAALTQIRRVASPSRAPSPPTRSPWSTIALYATRVPSNDHAGATATNPSGERTARSPPSRSLTSRRLRVQAPRPAPSINATVLVPRCGTTKSSKARTSSTTTSGAPPPAGRAYSGTPSANSEADTMDPCQKSR